MNKLCVAVATLLAISFGVDYSSASSSLEEEYKSLDDIITFDEKEVTRNLRTNQFESVYIGVFGGYLRGSIDFRSGYNNKVINRRAFSKDTGTFGLQGGINIVDNNILYGLETDLSYSKFKRRGDCELFVVECSYFVNPFASLRLRYGLIFDDSYLLYGTVGLSLANHTLRAKVDGIETKFNNLDTGLVLGLGFEKMFWKNFSFKGEYLFHQFEGVDFRASQFVDGRRVDAALYGDKMRLHMIRVGLNYHF